MKCRIGETQKINILIRAIKKLGKVNEDIVICSTDESLTFFAINSTHSVRPVIRLSHDYFTEYEYFHKKDGIIYQVTSKNISDCLKDISSPDSLQIEIDTEKILLVISVIDKFKIVHKYNLFLQDAVTSGVDYFSNKIYQTAKITMNTDILKDIEIAFKGSNQISIIIFKHKGIPFLRFIPENESSETNKDTNTCDLKIRDNPTCKIEISDENIQPLVLSYSDFRHVLRITQTFVSKFELYTSFSGQPIVIKANYKNCCEIESALATLSIVDNDVNMKSEDTQQEDIPLAQPKSHHTQNDEQQERKQMAEAVTQTENTPTIRPPLEPPKIPLPIQLSQSADEFSYSQMSQSSIQATQAVPWPGIVNSNVPRRSQTNISVSASQSEDSSLSDDSN